MLSDETSGSEEETMHYYSPASDTGLRSRKKKKPKAQSKTSQSLFSVIVSVNHGLVALQANATVRKHPILFSQFYPDIPKYVLWIVGLSFRLSFPEEG